MKKKHMIWATAALLLVAGFAVFVHAQATTAGHRRWGRRGMMMHRIARQLDLTDAQTAQIKQIWQAEEPTIQPLMQQLAANRKEILQAATTTGQFDQAKVQSLASQQAQTLTQLTVERAKIANQVYNLLTPEQRTKADQLREQWMNRMGKMGQGGAAKQPQP